MTRALDFIFMLTQDDRTVAAWPSLLRAAEHTGLRHIGCKDLGVDRSGLAAIAQAIGRLDATSYLELVGTTAADCETAAERAIECGFDCLLGGVDFPFPGRVSGHPVVATVGKLIVAGSVNSIVQINELKQAAVDAFTIGSALLSGSIFPEARSKCAANLRT